MLAGCGPADPPASATTPSPTSGPSTSASPTTSPDGSTAASPSPTDTPAPTDPPFDPATVSVRLEALPEAIPGGPLAITHAGDGSGRVFVAAKDGRVWILRDGVRSADPFLDIADLVSDGGEQGLLGLAFHPDFPADPRVFVDYTDRGGDTVVAWFRVPSADADAVDPGSRTVVTEIEQPFANHNGGAIAFGPDGYLYVALGDGGGAGDPADRARRLDTLLGKILRLDVDADPLSPGYAIPDGNPFGGVARARPEIWLSGLRNPWRMAFDRATGDLWFGDVGQGDWEEVDVARAGVGGLDFGWDRMEGSHCYEPARDCDRTGLVLPVTEYGHPEGCTIIGGVVYRGLEFPILRGGYLFADYCSGRMWAVAAVDDGPVEPVRVGTAGPGVVAFGEDEQGEVLVANLDGTLSRVTATRR